MIEILIKLKQSFSPKGYLFGCSKTDNPITVQNWQDGNNSLLVSEDGTWFCFAKKKNSNKINRFVVQLNCGNVDNSNCTINGIPPYQLVQQGGVMCNIAGLTPYQLTSSGGNNCVITGLQPYQLGGNVVVPEGIYAIPPQITNIPEETEWNRFRPDILPAISIPQVYDTILNKTVSRFTFSWHSPFRNMFGYDLNKNVTNRAVKAKNQFESMKRLGFSAIVWNFTEDCVEQIGNTGCNKEPSPWLDPSINLIVGTQVDSVYGETSQQYELRVVNDFVSGCANAGINPDLNGKYNVFMYAQNGENEYTGGNRQRDVNAKVNAYKKIASMCNGYVTDLYNAPTNSLGYIDDNFMNQSESYAGWYGLANEGVFSGQNQDNEPKIVSIAEMATYYEDMIPEGEWMKDQNGNDWIKISHFGSNLGVSNLNEFGTNGTANARHWATQYGGITYKNAKLAHSKGHKHLISFKPNNQVGSGYMYNDITQSGKRTFESGKWGAEGESPNENQYQSTGDTPLPNWMIEGAVILCMFENSDGIHYWNSAWHKDLFPVPKSSGNRNNEKRNNPELDRVPREHFTYMLRGQSRLGQKHTFADGTLLSPLDLFAMNGTEYMLDNTEYSIDNGINWNTGDPTIWQKNKLPPVLVVKNTSQKKAFIYAQEAYNECTSRGINKIKVRIDGFVFDVSILSGNIANIVGVSLQTISQP
jgi:hypothetical protein